MLKVSRQVKDAASILPTDKALCNKKQHGMPLQRVQQSPRTRPLNKTTQMPCPSSMTSFSKTPETRWSSDSGSPFAVPSSVPAPSPGPRPSSRSPPRPRSASTADPDLDPPTSSAAVVAGPRLPTARRRVWPLRWIPRRDSDPDSGSDCDFDFCTSPAHGQDLGSRILYGNDPAAMTALSCSWCSWGLRNLDSSCVAAEAAAVRSCFPCLPVA